MHLSERITYTIVGAAMGALMGAGCWWLYGLAHSLNYSGAALDPMLNHWVKPMAALFAIAGAIFGARVLDFLADTLGAILHFEMNDTPMKSAGLVFTWVLLGLFIAALWFTAKS